MAGLEIYWNGSLYQGYWEDAKWEYFGRYIKDNGYSYTGGLKQGGANGKGEEVDGDGSREIAYFVDGYKEGAAKYYDKNGNEQDRFYKKDKLVKK